MSLITPIRYPVKYYSWQDDNAPQLTDADGVIKTILKACLITGYGDKDGAGWQLLEEDGDMMTIRRPLGIGNPPDIRIENGQVGTENKHRIAFLSGQNEVYASNLLTRDRYCGQEWHLMVCDFGFLLCYQMGTPTTITNQNAKKNLMYVGSLQKLNPAQNEPFVVAMIDNVGNDGRTSSNRQMQPITSANFPIIEMATKTNIAQRFVLNFSSLTVSEKQAGYYVAQPIWLGKNAKMPFYCTLFKPPQAELDLNTDKISVAGRNFLRYVNAPSYTYHSWDILYIPLDYWEL